MYGTIPNVAQYEIITGDYRKNIRTYIGTMKVIPLPVHLVKKRKKI